MRIFIIIFALGGLVYFGLKKFDGMIHPPAPVAASATAAILPPSPFPAPPKPAAPAVSAVAPVLPAGQNFLGPFVGASAPAAASIGSAHRFYTFLNRDAPPAPFARPGVAAGGGGEKGLEVVVDAGSNSWVIRGPVIDVEQMMSIAKGLDVEQEQLDLDFILVAISEDFAKGWGVNALFNDGAAYLSAFSLQPSGLNLTLAHGGASLTFSATNGGGAARVVSSPVVRVVLGEKWEFSADTQVPIPTLQRSEGVVSTAYEYRKVGLGLSGTLAKAPRGQYRLRMEQRNGTVEGTSKEATTPPQLHEQLLKTSAVLQVGMWACVGGVRSWSSEIEKGIFSRSQKESQELLLVFARPRFQLESVPRAIPLAASPQGTLEVLAPYGPDPMAMDGNPLLPPKDWKHRMWPDGIEPKGGTPLPPRLGPPGK